MRTKKIFVGGLSATTSLEDVKAYFEQFSKVKESMLAYDKVTNRHRGFGFVTFDNEDVVDKICEIHFHEINGGKPALGFFLQNHTLLHFLHKVMVLKKYFDAQSSLEWSESVISVKVAIFK